MVQELTVRPPYVTFETKTIEDRQASIQAGHYVGKDVDFAFITPAGSKDRIEREVNDWFAKLAEDQAAARIPPEWVQHFKGMYRAYQEGRSAPVQGYPVRDWPGISPTQLKALQSLHLLAVEDVATANEETIARLGMGARALKQRAIDFLATANNVGKVAEEASALRTENAQLRSQVGEMTTTLQALTARLDVLERAGAAPIPAQRAAPAPESISASDLLDSAEKL